MNIINFVNSFYLRSTLKINISHEYFSKELTKNTVSKAVIFCETSLRQDCSVFFEKLENLLFRFLLGKYLHLNCRRYNMYHYWKCERKVNRVNSTYPQIYSFMLQKASVPIHCNCMDKFHTLDFYFKSLHKPFGNKHFGKSKILSLISSLTISKIKDMKMRANTREVWFFSSNFEQC